MEVFFLVGSAQALFFAILVFSKQTKSHADKILGCWLLILGIQLINPFIIYRNPEKYYYLGGLDASLFSLSAIFMFLYTKTITTTDGKFKPKWLIHLLAIVVINIAFIPFYTLSAEEKLKFVRKEEVLGLDIMIGAFLNMITFVSYVIATLFVIKKHKKKIRFEFSYEQNIDLKWLRNLIYSLAVMGLIFIGIVSFLALHQMHVYEADYYFYLILVLFIFGLGYWGFKQGTIFPYRELKSTPTPIKNEKKEKHISAEEQLAKELHRYMSQEKPYLDSKLTLYDLASSMNWSTHELSSLLNKVMKTNFYEYVNNYRIEEVKKRLKENNQKFTVLAIAFDAGFNSKASFNRIFKQKTGVTPSDFIHKNNS
jgi:AraC-like DNA-binding protein